MNIQSPAGAYYEGKSGGWADCLGGRVRARPHLC